MPDVEEAVPPFRILPKLTDWNRDFWTGGARGELRFWRCQDCGSTSTRRSRSARAATRRTCKTEAVSGDGDVGDVLGQPSAVDAGPGAAVHRGDRRDRRAAVGAAHDEPRELRARRRSRIEHAGAGHVRASPRSRGRYLHPAVRAGGMTVMDENDDHRTARLHLRRRAIRHRPPTVPRSARAHARRMPRRDRTRRTHHRRHRRHLDLPRADGRFRRGFPARARTT